MLRLRKNLASLAALAMVSTLTSCSGGKNFSGDQKKHENERDAGASAAETPEDAQGSQPSNVAGAAYLYCEGITRDSGGGASEIGCRVQDQPAESLNGKLVNIAGANPQWTIIDAAGQKQEVPVTPISGGLYQISFQLPKSDIPQRSVSLHIDGKAPLTYSLAKMHFPHEASTNFTTNQGVILMGTQTQSAADNALYAVKTAFQKSCNANTQPLEFYASGSAEICFCAFAASTTSGNEFKVALGNQAALTAAPSDLSSLPSSFCAVSYIELLASTVASIGNRYPPGGVSSKIQFTPSVQCATFANITPSTITVAVSPLPSTSFFGILTRFVVKLNNQFVDTGDLGCY